MSRLIDADAIYQWYTDAFDFSPNEIRFSMNDIRGNLYNIPTVDAVPRELYESMEATCYKLQQALSKSWIPCSERLPDEKGEYLLTLEMRDGTYECDMDKFNGKKWQYYHKDEPVAWMPLPEPYRGDDQ